MLYKYKSAAALLRLLDIVVHERLYCSPYAFLNDPFEGQFKVLAKASNWSNFFTGNFANGNFAPIEQQRNEAPMSHERQREYMDALQKIKIPAKYGDLAELPGVAATRVCSLSSNPHDVRMWSLYADSHAGVVIEVDCFDLLDKVNEVKYYDSLPKFGQSLITGPAATQVLTCKTKHWDYECEYRVIGEDEYFSIAAKIRRIGLGIRCNSAVEQLLCKVVPVDVEICRMVLDYDGVSLQFGEVVRQAIFPDPDDDPRGDRY